MNESEKLELGSELNSTSNSKPSAANINEEAVSQGSESKANESKKSSGVTLLADFVAAGDESAPNPKPPLDVKSAPKPCEKGVPAKDVEKPKATEKKEPEPKPAKETPEKPKAPAKVEAPKVPAKPKALPKKTTPAGKGTPPAKAGSVANGEPLYLPKPAPKAHPLARKPEANIVLLPYISLIFTPSGWQGLYKGLRKELWSKSFARRLILGTVIIPGIFIFFYLLFWASPSYISEAKFAVRGQATPSALEGLSSLFSFSSSTQNDSYIVLNYIMSLDMFTKLDKDLHLKEHYTDKKYDLWYRLWQNPTQDDIIRFWTWACEAKFDPDTSILEVQVKAFTPEKALAICQGILQNSEYLVNEMNLRSRKDAILKAEAEVQRAENRIREARKALQAYREKTVILDPGAVATGLYGVVNKLEGDVTQTAAELSEAMTYMNKDSPRVKQLENRLAVLQKQLAQEKKRLAGKVKGNESLSSLLSEFQNLSLEEEFAQKQLTSAMTSLEAARIQADAQTQYIEAFERPVLADQSLYPRPALFTLLYMVTTLLILGLVSLIVAAIREHAGF